MRVGYLTNKQLYLLQTVLTFGQYFLNHYISERKYSSFFFIISFWLKIEDKYLREKKWQKGKNLIWNVVKYDLQNSNTLYKVHKLYQQNDLKTIRKQSCGKYEFVEPIVQKNISFIHFTDTLTDEKPESKKLKT